MRSFYKYKSPENYNKLEWLRPQFLPLLNKEIENIISEDVDILCLSFFVWNTGHLIELAKRAKKHNPNILIIAGGPELDAHKRNNFFEEHPYIDYVAYGDGEEPFAAVLDSHLNKTHIPESAVNLVTRNKLYPHKVFSDKGFWNTSYILDMKDELRKDMDYLVNLNRKVKMSWEVDRGCPYSCSFCDWSSGLHHKVKRRSGAWKEEIDFLRTLPIETKFANANFGIYEEDVRIAEYIRDQNIQNIKIAYFAKMNKDRVWKIHDILSQYNKEHVIHISIQDVNEEVLNNINRPSLPWEEEKSYIEDFIKKHTNIMFYFEIIMGLPGQTVETFKYLLLQINSLNIKRSSLSNYHWHLLNNSPAYNKEYQEKFKLKFDDFFIPTVNDSEEYSRDISYEELNRLYNSGSAFPGKGRFVKESYSADTLEIIKIMIMMGIFSGVKNSNLEIDFTKIIFKPSFDRFLDEEGKIVLKSIERNKLWGRWCPIEKRWLSIDSYYHRLISITNFLEIMNYK
jgi:putative methyltransferase